MGVEEGGGAVGRGGGGAALGAGLGQGEGAGRGKGGAGKAGGRRGRQCLEIGREECVVLESDRAPGGGREGRLGPAPAPAAPPEGTVGVCWGWEAGSGGSPAHHSLPGPEGRRHWELGNGGTWCWVGLCWVGTGVVGDKGDRIGGDLGGVMGGLGAG